MGCHTWWARRMTDDEYKQYVKQATDEWYEYINDLKEWDYDNLLTDEILKAMQHSFETGECCIKFNDSTNMYTWLDVMNPEYKTDDGDIKPVYIGKHGRYIQIDYPDICRCTQYPDIEIHSYQQFMKFYKKHSGHWRKYFNKEQKKEELKYDVTTSYTYGGIKGKHPGESKFKYFHRTDGKISKHDENLIKEFFKKYTNGIMYWG